MLKKLLLAVVVFTACTAVAHAGIYAGASIGSAKVSDKESGFSFDKNDTGSKIFGGWSFMKFLGVEGAYNDLGSPEDNGVTVKINGWTLYGVGTLPIGKRFEIFGKAGFVFWNSDVNVSGGGGGGSDNGNDPAYGAGVGFKFGEHLGVRVEYERFDISDVDKVEVSSVGGIFRF